MLSVVGFRVLRLSVIMLSVVLPNVVAANEQPPIHIIVSFLSDRQTQMLA